MYCTFVITRYPKYLGIFGFVSMLLFRLPLWTSKKIKFWKLMGTGRGSTFSMRPDFSQWAVLFTSAEPGTLIPSFIKAYCRFFRCDIKQFLTHPTSGHGLWDGKQVFGTLPGSNNYNGPVAVLTRATIRPGRLKNFWRNVPAVSEKLNAAKGLIISYGMGELPWIKQATFSVWENEESMNAFAYSTQEHMDVIRKTREESWYREELFVRLRIVSVAGFDEKIAAKMCNLPALYEEA